MQLLKQDTGSMYWLFTRQGRDIRKRCRVGGAGVCARVRVRVRVVCLCVCVFPGVLCAFSGVCVCVRACELDKDDGEGESWDGDTLVV